MIELLHDEYILINGITQISNFFYLIKYIEAVRNTLEINFMKYFLEYTKNWPSDGFILRSFE